MACRMLILVAIALLGTYVLFGRRLRSSSKQESDPRDDNIGTHPSPLPKYRDLEHLEKLKVIV